MTAATTALFIPTSALADDTFRTLLPLLCASHKGENTALSVPTQFGGSTLQITSCSGRVAGCYTAAEGLLPQVGNHSPSTVFSL